MTPSLRDRPLIAVAVTCALAIVSGGILGLAALVAGFHGNAPVIWVLINGPTAWACRLADSDSTYLWILGLSTALTWTAYWTFLIFGPSRLTGMQRAIFIASLHFAFAAAYHLVFGSA